MTSLSICQQNLPEDDGIIVRLVMSRVDECDYALLHQAAQSVAWKINIPAKENVRPLVVFNPLMWPVKTNVEIESSRLKPEMALVDESGNVVRYQGVQSATTAGRNRLCFTAAVGPRICDGERGVEGAR